MPVRSSVDEPDFLTSINMNDLYTGSGSEYLISDDIWKKFELEADDLANSFDEYFWELDDTDYLSDLYPMLDCVIRNHDCMWAGHCASKEHTTVEDKTEKLPTQGVWKAPVQRQTVLPGRSVLLKPPAKTPAPVAASPDSPPMSDDEETKAKPSSTPMVQIINDAIEECENLDDDSDLNEYFEDGEDEDIVRDPKDEEEEEEEGDDEDDDEEQQAASVARYAGENDHCYFMDKNAYGRVNGLGIDTPSDSEEEEIDVVSVNEKLTTKLTYALPTNPSTRDRQQLQKTMATAISNKRLPSSRIKTILPIRKPSTETSPVKRKTETRGIKRSIHRSAGNSPNKRRSPFASDSEPEPSEKRNMHNNMERQRRIDLRNAFEDLRMLVPEVSCKEKAAKVAILREAAQYCYHLGNVSANVIRQKLELKRQQERLRTRVSQLRKSLAAKR